MCKCFFSDNPIVLIWNRSVESIVSNLEAFQSHRIWISVGVSKCTNTYPQWGIYHKTHLMHTYTSIGRIFKLDSSIIPFLVSSNKICSLPKLDWIQQQHRVWTWFLFVPVQICMRIAQIQREQTHRFLVNLPFCISRCLFTKMCCGWNGNLIRQFFFRFTSTLSTCKCCLCSSVRCVAKLWINKIYTHHNAFIISYHLLGGVLRNTNIRNHKAAKKKKIYFRFSFIHLHIKCLFCYYGLKDMVFLLVIKFRTFILIWRS